MRHSPDWPSGGGRDESPSILGWAVLLLGWGLFVVGMGSAPAAAQTTDDDDGARLIERYRTARYRVLAQRLLRREGRMPVYPPERLPTPSDSLFRPEAASDDATAEPPSFPLRTVRRVRHLERSWFRNQYSDVEWAFLGDTPHHTYLDTTRTPHLRARLEAEFGAPTRTLADKPLDKPPGERTQFEYWFVVNDSIPVQVMDPMGPKGRGLILAADRTYRKRLRPLRDTLLAPLRRVPPDPYVDYYYDTRRERWYRTGFDGQSYFLEQISGTAVVPGQRPRLDSMRTSETAPPSDESSP